MYFRCQVTKSSIQRHDCFGTGRCEQATFLRRGVTFRETAFSCGGWSRLIRFRNGGTMLNLISTGNSADWPLIHRSGSGGGATSLRNSHAPFPQKFNILNWQGHPHVTCLWRTANTQAKGILQLISNNCLAYSNSYRIDWLSAGPFWIVDVDMDRGKGLCHWRERVEAKIGKCDQIKIEISIWTRTTSDIEWRFAALFTVSSHY